MPADGDVAGEPGGGEIERDPVVADAGLEAPAALADPALELRYALPGVGWVDERGRPTPAPEGEGGEITRAVVPGGGEVALVHGAAGAGDARLAEAAAAAAALALDSTRLEAAVQARAAEVRASRRRLLTAADAERRVLEAQLSEGPLADLRRVGRLLPAANGTTALRNELQAVIVELAELARGLYPPALVRAELAGAIEEMARRSPVPATVHVTGDLGVLTDELRATTWFVCSEALVNVAGHAGATRAQVTVAAAAQELLIEIRDDGRGGAAPTRGLRGARRPGGDERGHVRRREPGRWPDHDPRAPTDLSLRPGMLIRFGGTPGSSEPGGRRSRVQPGGSCRIAQSSKRSWVTSGMPGSAPSSVSRLLS